MILMTLDGQTRGSKDVRDRVPRSRSVKNTASRPLVENRLLDFGQVQPTVGSNIAGLLAGIDAIGDSSRSDARPNDHRPSERNRGINRDRPVG